MTTTYINTLCGLIQMDTYEADATNFTSLDGAIIFARDSVTDGPYFEPINAPGRDWSDLHNAIRVIADTSLYYFADEIDLTQSNPEIILDKAADYRVDKWEAWVTNDPVKLYDMAKAELLEYVENYVNQDYAGEGIETLWGDLKKIREVATAALELIMDREHDDVNDAIEAAIEA